jgi:hypothetical protein
MSKPVFPVELKRVKLVKTALMLPKKVLLFYESLVAFLSGEFPYSLWLCQYDFPLCNLDELSL